MAKEIEKKIPKIKLNELHTFEIDALEFGDLPKEILIEIFKDGRASSKLMEHIFAQRYALIPVKGDKDYDLISETGVKYEVKAFTKYGCSFGPSMHTGDKGLSKRIRLYEGEEAYKNHRENKLKELQERTASLIYFIYDLNDFPKIKYIIKKGEDLLKEYPSGRIPYKHREVFFG
jgi:hypothetical protein